MRIKRWKDQRYHNFKDFNRLHLLVLCPHRLYDIGLYAISTFPKVRQHSRSSISIFTIHYFCFICTFKRTHIKSKTSRKYFDVDQMNELSGRLWTHCELKMSMPFVDDRNDRRNEYKSKTVFEIPLEDTRSDLKIVKYPIGFKSTDSFWPLICQKDTDFCHSLF